MIKQKGSDIGLTKEIEECQRPRTMSTSECRNLYELSTSFSKIKFNVSVSKLLRYFYFKIYYIYNKTSV